MAGIVRTLNDDGTCVVCITKGGVVDGFANLVAGSYYKPKTDGSGFDRTTVAAEAKALAISTTAMRLL